jgi:hypothetical protein
MMVVEPVPLSAVKNTLGTVVNAVPNVKKPVRGGVGIEPL